jgi:UDP-N-acetylglucosamine 2-epimerase (non-hydrolysing)
MGRRIMAVVGARPNFMKIAPIWRAMEDRRSLERVLVHTGQHYDENMSKVFFEDLNLPKPDIFLGVGSAPHGEQTGTIMIEFERALVREGADMVVVVGDVNSTMACTLVAVKMGIPVAHVEAGLRSFDRAMPEEINRMVTDILADVLLTTCRDAEKNLLGEGIAREKIHFVGNVMIDSLHYYRPMTDRSKILGDLSLDEEGYGLITLHRPSNVDEAGVLANILEAFVTLADRLPFVFPVHPRTRKMLENMNVALPPEKIRLIEPIGYLDFLKLMCHSKIVLTDSGGIQEETTVLGIPCLTIRENTERPITIEIGTNVLVGMDKERIIEEGTKVLEGTHKQGTIPELWDGHASERIVNVIENYLS